MLRCIALHCIDSFFDNRITGFDLALMRNWKSVTNASGITDDNVARLIWGRLKQLQSKVECATSTLTVPPLSRGGVYRVCACLQQLEKIKQKMSRQLIPFEQLNQFIDDPGLIHNLCLCLCLCLCLNPYVSVPVPVRSPYLSRSNLNRNRSR